MDDKFDVRTLEHKLRRGVLSRDEVNKHLAALPDEADEGVETETRFVSSFAAREDAPEAGDGE